jgi:hypothetical protein
MAKGRTSYTKAKGKRVVELRESGETLTAIAARYKTTVPTIGRWIKKATGATSTSKPRAKGKSKSKVSNGATIVIDRSKLDLTDDAQFRWFCFGVQQGIINPS